MSCMTGRIKSLTALLEELDIRRGALCSRLPVKDTGDLSSSGITGSGGLYDLTGEASVTCGKEHRFGIR